jgi:hypothetical protein
MIGHEVTQNRGSHPSSEVLKLAYAWSLSPWKAPSSFNIPALAKRNGLTKRMHATVDTNCICAFATRERGKFHNGMVHKILIFGLPAIPRNWQPATDQDFVSMQILCPCKTQILARRWSCGLTGSQ